MENGFSLLNLFTGDIMTIVVSVVLVGFSVMSWAIIIEKIRLWKMVKRNPVKLKASDNLDVAPERLIRPFDRNLWVLSMVAYVSPFIGLFGTVWGIMDSFNAIGLTQSTNIAAVAPGVAEALFTTAVGLIAAIPAVIAYNKLSNDIDRIAHRMETFSDELSAILSRQIEHVEA